MSLPARTAPQQAGPGSLTVTASLVALFLVAWVVRLRFHSGFVLGDDAEEYPLIRSLVMDGPSFEGHLRYRFPMWVFNYLAQLVFGNYEASFFLPTWLLSSLLPVLACATLRAAGYGLPGSLFAGAFVALSPFEVLIGGVRANDLFVEFFLACALWIFVRWQHAPRAQGAGVALALWLAFYAKLWSLFLYPVVGAYYLLRVRADARGLLAFVVTSFVLHAGACVFWWVTTGTATPFFEHLSATYPVPTDQLRALFLTYPRVIFVGSEHGNSLFGLVPYLLVGALALKLLLSRVPRLVARAPRIALDRYDVWLLWSLLVFSSLLNFFPNSFTFDRYYSAPRIFRYLAPLSYGFSLLAPKLLVDLGDLVFARLGLRRIAALAVLLVLGAGIFVAVGPSRSHHARVGAIRAELRTSCPPLVVIEPWQGLFFRELHLREACPDTVVRTSGDIYEARDYERWLRQLEPGLPKGAMLVTGLTRYVYYERQTWGLRLSYFEARLGPGWTLLREFDPLPFDRAREPIRIWRSTTGPRSVSEQVPALAPQQLFGRGIERFDAQDYPEARAFMLAILERFPGDELCDDAAYFAAVTHWREHDIPRTIREFRNLTLRFPHSRWVAAAHYHIGLSHRLMGRERQAEEAFEAAVASSSAGTPEREYALTALDAMVEPPPLSSVGSSLTEFVYRFQEDVDRFESWVGQVKP